ncbi:Rv2231c family pyridoxal phosphate-dependent protein CobC [Nocardioides limicola]|uniref:Rv2231c family pyridoxal phosphate-dependent protein CobC n=1 Tax=Nocardioides limicola TaxID=2803368 RepID=UPI00193B570D|nr:Rv2231c family pyridoxal phosphate-dependent protein CobC [Nocardioides sp. DJM-14]
MSEYLLGVGGRPEADAGELRELAGKLLADHGVNADQVTAVATLDRRADHPGIRHLAATLAAAVRSHTAAELARQPVAAPSARTRAAVGTPSVAEAAVRAAGADLLGATRRSTHWTVALGRVVDLDHHGDTEVGGGLVDFAVNVHGTAPPPFLSAAVTDAIAELAAYPDPHRGRAAVAAAHGVPAESVLLTHGAAEAFTLIAQQPWRSPLLVHPQFTEPEAALRAAGHAPARLLLTSGTGFRITTEPETDPDLVMVGNPTNPTSRLHTHAELARLRTPGRLLVVDEAFMDAVEGIDTPRHSLAPKAAADPDLLVVRSLTKTYALAGLRVGYLIGHPDRLATLTRRRTPWPVGTLAAAAAEACVGEEGREYAAQVRADLPARLHRLTQTLIDRGFEVTPDAAAPFLLARRADAAELRTRLRDRGIAVRRGDTFPGLDDTWLRFAARGADEVATLRTELDAALP